MGEWQDATSTWLAIARNRTGSVPWLNVARLRVKAGFDEASHPRDDSGKFSGGGGSGGEMVPLSSKQKIRPGQHVLERAQERATVGAVIQVIGKARKQAVFPADMRQAWYLPVKGRGGRTLGYLCGNDSIAKTVLAPGMRLLANAVEIQLKAIMWLDLAQARLQAKASLSVQCTECANFEGPYRSGYHCQAFPSGIPKAILDGSFDHEMPYPGDHGVRFEEENA